MNTESTLIIIAIMGLLVIAMAALVVSNRKFQERLENQASKRGGIVESNGWLSPKKVVFQNKGQRVEIFSVPGSRYNPPRTVAQVILEAARLNSLRLRRNDLMQKLLVKFGRERLTTGDEEFDARWLVETASPALAAKLLTSDLKMRMAERMFRTCELKIEPQTVTLSILSIPRNDEEYDSFIDTALLVLRNIDL
jgi:hypothetical protein